MSAYWRRLYPKAAGSLPGGMVTQWGVGITVLLVLVLLTAWIYLSGGSGTASTTDEAGSRREWNGPGERG